MMKTSLSGERIVFLDYLRVVAIFMVLVVHSIEPFYLGGEGTLLSSYGDAMWVTFLDSALRCAVPLFVMTSSYLLVPVAGDGITFLKRRFLRVGKKASSTASLTAVLGIQLYPTSFSTLPPRSHL